MTEPTSTEPTLVETIPYMPDPFLQVLADLIAKSDGGSGTGLTVVAGGQVITGRIIRRDDWFDAVAETVEEYAADEISRTSGRTMLEGFKLAAQNSDEEVKAAAEDGVDTRSAGYLNFVDCEANGRPTTPLRVQIGSVTAWALGFRR